MDNTILAYAAGLIDGEGSISLPRNYKTSAFRRPLVSVASTTIELVDFMKLHFGGCVCTKRSKKFDHHKTAYQWAIQYQKAITVLAQLLPYLQVPSKRQRATMLVNEFSALTPKNGKYTPEQRSAKLMFEERFLAS